MITPGNLAAFLWNARGFADNHQPAVVYLGSEGQTGVAAASFDDFLRLLGTGYHPFDLIINQNKNHFTESKKGPEEQTEIPESHANFLHWLKSKCKLTPPANVDEITGKLAQTRTTFESWVRSRVIARGTINPKGLTTAGTIPAVAGMINAPWGDQTYPVSIVEVYGKLVHINFADSDKGWALALDCHKA